MAKKATIKDVARVAGVSISTVSRVLNNSANVESALKVRVQEAVKETKYTPNEIARSLKRKNSAMIAYVVSNTADPFFTFISRGIEEVMYRNGYNIINCSTNFSVERECSLLNTLYERRVDGIIINTVGNNDAEISKISQNIPTVLSNRMVSSSDFVGDFVDFDNVGGVIKLTNHLLELGHRRIAFLNGPIRLSTAKERQDGFLEGMRNAGLEIPKDYKYLINTEDTFSMQDGYDAARKIMTMDQPPTAIIASNTEMALGAMKYCRKHNISIPGEVSLCSFGNIAHQELMYVDITHTYTDLLVLGNRIGEMMLQRIAKDGASQPNREVRFDTPLVLGDSTKAI